MSATQVQAGLGLLKKVLPDLAAVEISGEQEVRHVIAPTLPSPEQWERERTERPAAH